MKAWLFENYPDLDIKEGEQEEDEILANEEFGVSSEEREERLVKAKKVVKVLNIAGGVIGLWTIFYPDPYQYLIVGCIAIPVFCLIVLKRFNGLVRIDEKKGSPYPSIAWAVLITAGALVLRALFDYNILDYSKVWLPAVLIMVAFVLIGVIGNKEFKFDKGKSFLAVIFLSILLFGYGYGTVVTLNCMYDSSRPEKFRAQIEGKRIDKGKTTTYYLLLAPWGPQKQTTEVSVTKSLFSKLAGNDSVNVYLMKGFFKIPWVQVTE